MPIRSSFEMFTLLIEYSVIPGMLLKALMLLLLVNQNPLWLLGVKFL